MTDSPSTQNVRAIVVSSYGGPDTLTATEVRLKAPAHGEVLVRRAGARDVILCTEQDFAEEALRLTDGHGADLIVDGTS